jgi:uncharacterized membrane protein
MKPPYFENVAQQIVERKAHAKFMNADRETESNRPLFHLLKLIGIGFVIAFLMTFGVGVLIYNDAPVWIWSIVILSILVVLSVSVSIVWSAINSQLLDRQAKQQRG